MRRGSPCTHPPRRRRRARSAGRVRRGLDPHSTFAVRIRGLTASVHRHVAGVPEGVVSAQGPAIPTHRVLARMYGPAVCTRPWEKGAQRLAASVQEGAVCVWRGLPPSHDPLLANRAWRNAYSGASKTWHEAWPAFREARHACDGISEARTVGRNGFDGIAAACDAARIRFDTAPEACMVVRCAFSQAADGYRSFRDGSGVATDVYSATLPATRAGYKGADVVVNAFFALSCSFSNCGCTHRSCCLLFRTRTKALTQCTGDHLETRSISPGSLDVQLQPE